MKSNLSLDLLISFMYMINKRGPRNDPCGTPVEMS